MTEYWKSNEKHYCKLCNSWMGADKQSIALHEGGKKHKDMFADSLRKKRESLASSDRAGSALQAELRAMNAAASESRSSDALLFGGGGGGGDSGAGPNYGGPPPSSGSGSLPAGGREDDGLSLWHDSKRRRNDEREKGPVKSNVALLPSSSSSSSSSSSYKGKNASGSSVGAVVSLEDQPSLDTGHYEIDGVRYLEGRYFSRLLHADIAAQCWLLPSGLRPAEETSEEDSASWICGLITEVRSAIIPGTNPPKSVLSVDFSFLPDGAEDETLAKDLPPVAFRLRLGDYGCPSSLPSALVACAVGVTAVSSKPTARALAPAPDDGNDEEDGGGNIGSWETIEVRTLTAKQAAEEESARRAEQRDLEDQTRRQREAEARTKKLEMAKFENKDDSALGSYNVWGSEGGYKGVAILGGGGERDALGSALEPGVLVKEGEKVEFKKKSRQTGNKRVTGADD